MYCHDITSGVLYDIWVGVHWLISLIISIGCPCFMGYMSVCASISCTTGIGPWKLAMLSACLLLWDIMWKQSAPSFDGEWQIQAACTVTFYANVAACSDVCMICIR